MCRPVKEYSDEYFVQLRVLRAVGAGEVVAETRFPSVWDDTLALAISPDGGQVAIASGDVRLAIYRLPDLKTIKEFQFPFHERREDRISQLAYSPDGKWLAAAQERRPTPRLFRAATGEEVMPYEGHGDTPVDLRFLPDGKTLRSIGAGWYGMHLGCGHSEDARSEFLACWPGCGQRSSFRRPLCPLPACPRSETANPGDRRGNGEGVVRSRVASYLERHRSDREQGGRREASTLAKG